MGVRTTILRRIKRHLKATGLGRCAFGIAAVGQREFVRHLERGKSITLARIEQAEAYLDANMPVDGARDDQADANVTQPARRVSGKGKANFSRLNNRPSPRPSPDRSAPGPRRAGEGAHARGAA